MSVAITEKRAAQADKLANDFVESAVSVEKFPLFGPDNERTQHYGLRRTDNGEWLSQTFQKDYVPHTPQQVADCIRAAAIAFDSKCRVNTWFKEGHHVSITAGKAHRVKVAGHGLFPTLILRAGYDGRSFAGMLAMQYDRCQNLMMLGRVGRGASAKIRHSAKMVGGIDNLIGQFTAVTSHWETILETVGKMEISEVTLGEYLAAVDPKKDNESSNTQGRRERRWERIMQRATNEAGRGFVGPQSTVSVWDAYNAVQGYVQHDATRHGNPTDAARAFGALSSQLVARAEREALAIAG